MDNDIIVYAKGLSFQDDRYDLRQLEILISSYRSILDGLVAVQLGRRQLTPAIKKQIGYDVKIKSGSIELLIDFAFQHKELLAITTASAGAEDGGVQISTAIVKLFRSAIDLRKKAAECIKKGVTFNISINNSFNRYGNNNVIYNEQSNKIEITDPKILWAAQLTKPPTDKILNHVDGKKIEFIDLKASNHEFKLTEYERIILGAKKEILPANLEVVGRLDMVAFSSHTGSIVSSSERFPVTWDETIRARMQKVADVEGVIFTVKPVIDPNRLHTNAIGFHVLDCRDPQSGLI